MVREGPRRVDGRMLVEEESEVDEETEGQMFLTVIDLSHPSARYVRLAPRCDAD